MRKNTELVNAIYNANQEIHYNEYTFKNKAGSTVKIDLTGKIKCPALNSNISPIVCSTVMDKESWPRGIDLNICKKCNCYINLSIKKFQSQTKK